MTQTTTAHTVSEVLNIYSKGDDLILKWNSPQRANNMDNGRRASLEIKTIDGIHLVSLYCLDFDTILAALGTTPEELEKRWSHDYRYSTLRVRKTVQGFEIRHLS